MSRCLLFRHQLSGRNFYLFLFGLPENRIRSFWFRNHQHGQLFDAHFSDCHCHDFILRHRVWNIVLVVDEKDRKVSYTEAQSDFFLLFLVFSLSESTLQIIFCLQSRQLLSRLLWGLSSAFHWLLWIILSTNRCSKLGFIFIRRCTLQSAWLHLQLFHSCAAVQWLRWCTRFISKKNHFVEQFNQSKGNLALHN